MLCQVRECLSNENFTSDWHQKGELRGCLGAYGVQVWEVGEGEVEEHLSKSLALGIRAQGCNTTAPKGLLQHKVEAMDTRNLISVNTK